MESNGPAVVFAGGDPVPDAVRHLLPQGALVVAADSGLDLARRLGVPVDLVVGDFDSADPAGVAAAVAAGSLLERHPADKDATDLELALDAVLRLGRSPVRIVGGAGWDRLDHLVANFLLVASPRYAPLRLRWWVKGAEVAPVHGRLDLAGAPGRPGHPAGGGGPGHRGHHHRAALAPARRDPRPGLHPRGEQRARRRHRHRLRGDGSAGGHPHREGAVRRPLRSSSLLWPPWPPSPAPAAARRNPTRCAC